MLLCFNSITSLLIRAFASMIVYTYHNQLYTLLMHYLYSLPIEGGAQGQGGAGP